MLHDYLICPPRARGQERWGTAPRKINAVRPGARGERKAGLTLVAVRTIRPAPVGQQKRPLTGRPTVRS